MCPHSILIVDDEADIREIAQLSLEIGGWDVRSAASGPEAIAAATQDPPDAMLLDVMMPEMDGPETLRRLRGDPRTSGIPVIFLTAKVQLSEQQQLKDLNSCGVIAKPFDPMVLADQVADLVEEPTR